MARHRSHCADVVPDDGLAAQPQSVFNGTADYFECECLQQSQHLDELAAARLAEPRLQQAPQRDEAVRQLPAYQRSSLVKRPCLLFE